MKIIESARYYPKVGIGFRTSGDEADSRPEVTRRPFVEQVAQTYGFRITHVAREFQEASNCEYCLFELEATQEVGSHEAWWEQVDKVTDAFPNCLHCYTLSPWQHDDITPYLKACDLHLRSLKLDRKSFVFKTGERIRKAMESLEENISRNAPSEQRRLVLSKEFQHLADELRFYFEWVERNIEHMQ